MVDILPLLNLQLKPGQDPYSRSQIDVHCPFCGHSGYHLNINLAKDQFTCPHCKAGGGVMRLYALCTRGADVDFDSVKREIRKEIGEKLDAMQVPAQYKPTARFNIVQPAKDELLNAAYSMLLRFKCLSLSKPHLANLRDRGLSDAAIRRNGYRTFPLSCQRLVPEHLWDLFATKELAETLKTNTRYHNMRFDQVVLGMSIAAKIIQMGVKLDRVPGFFKINGNWCLRIIPGMVIPVRNHNGLIVGIQIRKDNGPTKYLTLSSKGLPGGVNVEISRAHFPLVNLDAMTECKLTSALITEGPLKADICAELMKVKHLVLSIPGVKTTTPLEKEYEWIHAQGITHFYNALDMDKLTNPNVRSGSLRLNGILKEKGFTVSQLCWDAEYAREKYAEIRALCGDMPSIPSADTIRAYESGDVFTALALLAQEAENAGIEHSTEVAENGEKKHFYWSRATKGIDDYLINQ